MSADTIHYRRVMNINVDPNDKGAPGAQERLAFSKMLIQKYTGLTLEIGPGGRASSDNAILLDINKGFLKLSPQRERIQGDFRFLPFKPATFDMVIWLEGPEHATQPDLVLQQIQNILKTRGHLIISCPESPFLDDDWQHVTHFKEEDLYRLLSKYFKLIKIYKIARYLIAECEKE